MEGGPELFWIVKEGGTSFFSGSKGDQHFFLHMPRGGGDQKKLVTADHKQTAPSPGKKMIAPLLMVLIFPW